MRPFFRKIDIASSSQEAFFISETFRMEGFFYFRSLPPPSHEPEGFFHVKGKKMSQEDDYFSSIGNTYSASDNPDEYARYLDKQAEKQRREQEKNRPGCYGNNN